MARPSAELVVDTSVVVKFFFPEPGSDKAVALLRSILAGTVVMVALDFLFVEFVNVVWLRTRRGECLGVEAEQSIAQLLRLSALMEIVPVRAIMPETFDASCQYGHPAYDCALLALAARRGVRFVTADKKLHRRLPASLRWAVLLDDLDVE